MKHLTIVLCAVLIAGCAGTHPKGTARFDDYDSVKVEQMVGNNISQAVFAKTIVCLNARRETRRVTGLTNTMVTSATNQTVSAVTNQTISFSTNLLYTSMTNLAPAAPPPTPLVTGDATTSGAETNIAIAVNSPASSSTTNVTVSLANNSSGSRAPSQNTANSQVIRTLNLQLSTTSNNLSIALMTNLVFTGETNLIISYVTNASVVSVTNTVITPTNGVAYDYFLFSELIPPPDFTPQQQGESLVLLVDGVRYGCTPSQSGTAFVSRKGYTSTLYRVSPDVIVAIANARNVRLRFKGVNNVVERTMNHSSRQNFRTFLGRYFVSPDSGASAASKPVAAVQEATNVANR